MVLLHRTVGGFTASDREAHSKSRLSIQRRIGHGGASFFIGPAPTFFPEHLPRGVKRRRGLHYVDLYFIYRQKVHRRIGSLLETDQALITKKVFMKLGEWDPKMGIRAKAYYSRGEEQTVRFTAES